MNLAERKAIGARNAAEVEQAMRGLGWSVTRLELDGWFLDAIRHRRNRLSKLPDWAAYHVARQHGPILVDAKGGGLQVEHACMVSHRALLDQGYGDDVLYVFAVAPGELRAAWLDTVERHGTPCEMPSGMPGRALDLNWLVALEML